MKTGVRAVFGVSEQKPYFTALISELTKKKLFIVVPSEGDVVKTQAVMNRLAGKSLSFPTKDYNFRTVESVSRFDENRRIETVAAIRKKEFSSVVIPAEALCTLVMPPEDYREMTIRPADTVEFDKMADILVSFGYERFNNVTGQGQFSIRGGIVDIFPPSEAQPYRIEFWDNDVDTVSLFDVNTQRRTEPVDGVRITPAKEYRAEIAEKLLEATNMRTRMRKNYAAAFFRSMTAGCPPATEKPRIFLIMRTKTRPLYFLNTTPAWKRSMVLLQG